LFVSVEIFQVTVEERHIMPSSFVRDVNVKIDQLVRGETVIKGDRNMCCVYLLHSCGHHSETCRKVFVPLPHKLFPHQV
jgi:hypothetical protein